MLALVSEIGEDPVRSIEVAMGAVVVGLYFWSFLRVLYLARAHHDWWRSPHNRLQVGRLFAILTVLTFSAGALHALIDRWGEETTLRSILWSLAWCFALVRWVIIDRIEWRVL